MVQNRQREVKNSIGNEEAKELICATHGHELRRGVEGIAGGNELGGGRQSEENWDNCNSIINKIYF